MSAPTWHPKTGTKYVGPATCPCEFGPCGHCTSGDHARCVWLADPAEAARLAAKLPVVFLMDRAGYVPILPDVRGTVAKVYLDRAGAHTWHCPCDLSGHGLTDAAEGQLDLFGEVTA